MEKINQIIKKAVEILKKAKPISYRGEWRGQNAKRGDVYSYKGNLYYCKAEKTIAAPDTDDWGAFIFKESELQPYIDSKDKEVDEQWEKKNDNV